MNSAKSLSILSILGVILLFGCAQVPPPQDKIISNFEQCAAAGNPVMESYPRQCRAGNQTFVEESCQSRGNILTLADAIEIAKQSECGDRLIVNCTCPEGYVKEGEGCTPECYYSEPKCMMPSILCEKTYFCNENTGTYWIDLDLSKEGCKPACVVDLATRQASINWRCTGGEPLMCTADAMLCPDGSWVGRDPYSNCSFYPCLELQYCDANTYCHRGQTCYKFEDLKNPVCFAGSDPCSRCASGKCMVLESYPEQIRCES